MLTPQPNQMEEATENEDAVEQMDIQSLAGQLEDIVKVDTANNPSEWTDKVVSESDHVDNVAIAYIPPKFEVPPTLIYEEEFEVFTKGVKFCGDGQTFAVCTDDKRIHVRKTSDLLDGDRVPDRINVENVATVTEAQPIHDFVWNPNHEFCAFATTCNTQPIHLYCGQTGKFLCSYVARNHLDEHISAYSVVFNRDGTKILGGFKKFVRIFDVECPGVWTEVSTWKLFQAGIVSAIDTVNDHLLAVGTYCDTVALYDLRDKGGKMVELPQEGHEGGVTQVRFSYDGTLLYSGARKDDFILCRDIRNFGEIVHKFPRKCTTNQRIHFDLPYEEDYLATGNTDGTCSIWNRRQPLAFTGEPEKCRPNLIFAPHADFHVNKSSATNGVSFHRWAPVIATSSGGRETSYWDEENEKIAWRKPFENRVKLWRFDKKVDDNDDADDVELNM